MDPRYITGAELPAEFVRAQDNSQRVRVHVDGAWRDVEFVHAQNNEYGVAGNFGTLQVLDINPRTRFVVCDVPE